ncbi:Xaa-Pro peptidase family protein [Agrococcus sp. ARC_14]|uniref:M24 family metallopeptidase n=1 Tax=Agrococcus sp. ARC_14 TaxID=2919927 RepID=UPI001F06103A|nr:Xaa-Pro peptidase family protein [Agrococcus sp. ARC_14]MCH1881919.1 Xaa-Pro peptidase family protein [Agrococcus sp. ARC_14]
MTIATTASTDLGIAQIRARLKARGLAGYVAFTPSNLFYVTGFRSYFVSEWWRLHGTVLAFVPADESLPVTLMLGDFEEKTARAAAPEVELATYPLWVDLSTAEQMELPSAPEPGRPEQWDAAELDRIAADALHSLGMASGRIATDLPHVTLDTWHRLRRSAPDVEWVDFTDDIYEVRLIKQEWEIERLRTAVELSERGMVGAMQIAREGMTASDIRAAYQISVATAAIGEPRFAGYTDNWVLPTVGGTTSAGYGSTASGLRAGDLVKFDCGTTVHGYRSDGGRTFAFGQPSSEAQRLYDVLAEAQRIARDSLVPGARVGDAFFNAIGHVHSHGYPTFNRGHVGHSVGIDTFHEEPPFIGPACDVRVEPGMVLAVEVPTYTPDVGAIMIEDLVVIRDHGAELLHTLPHELTVIEPRA